MYSLPHGREVLLLTEYLHRIQLYNHSYNKGLSAMAESFFIMLSYSNQQFNTRNNSYAFYDFCVIMKKSIKCSIKVRFVGYSML